MADEKAVKLTPDKIVAAADRVVEIVRQTNAKARGVQSIWTLFRCAEWIVKAVERIGNEIGALGPDKKAIAVQGVLTLIPDAWCPDWVLEPLVSWAIEKAVAAMRSKTKAAD